MILDEEKTMATPDVDQYEQVADLPSKEQTGATATVDDLDLSNSKAYKGDDSDGKVVWTPKTVLAFLSLAGLNTGIFYYKNCGNIVSKS